MSKPTKPSVDQIARTLCDPGRKWMLRLMPRDTCIGSSRLSCHVARAFGYEATLVGVRIIVYPPWAAARLFNEEIQALPLEQYLEISAAVTRDPRGTPMILGHQPESLEKRTRWGKD